MTKQEKADAIGQILENLYPETPIPLDHADAYTLLIAVLLSAQCSDVRVNKVTPALFSRANNPFDMVKMEVSEIREIIKPCGLSPRKSQGIFDLSGILIDKYGGAVPPDFAALEALPCVGHKTASVVMSQAFGVPAMPVDTHIHRLATRWVRAEFNMASIISGKVLDGNRQAISGARVFFSSGPVALPDVAALTNDKGEFTLSAPVPGVYTIEVAADGFRQKQIEISNPGASGLLVELEPSTN